MRGYPEKMSKVLTQYYVKTHNESYMHSKFIKVTVGVRKSEIGIFKNTIHKSRFSNGLS